MLEVEFCLMFYLFYDASSYQKVISWNLQRINWQIRKISPGPSPQHFVWAVENLPCWSWRKCWRTREESWSIPFFFGDSESFRQKPMLLDDKNFVHPKNLHCSNTFLPWNALKIATKFWRGSWLNDLGPPRYLSIFFIFLHRKRWRKTTSRLHNVALGMASWPSTWLTAYDSACLFAKVGRSKSHESGNCGDFCLDVANFFRQNFRIHWLVFFRLPIWENLGKVRRTFLPLFAYASPKSWKLWFCSHWVPED